MLLTEWKSFDDAQLSALYEGEEGKGKDLYLSGIFIQGGVRNHNQRVYPVSEIRNAVEEINERIAQNGGVAGECDHPDTLTINLDRISHKITKMWMDGNNGMGKLKMIDTPKGLVISKLIESGLKLGVSSRGSGNVGHDGQVSDFEIVTVDIVYQPSAPQAYPKPVYEALDTKRGVLLEELAVAIQHDPKAQKYFHKEVLNLISNLK